MNGSTSNFLFMLDMDFIPMVGAEDVLNTYKDSIQPKQVIGCFMWVLYLWWWSKSEYLYVLCTIALRGNVYNVYNVYYVVMYIMYITYITW